MSLFECSASPRTETVTETACKGPSYPLSFMHIGEPGTIVRISGRDEVKKYLAGLGFIPGTEITVINSINGNVIIDIRGSRVAIDSGMASKISCCQKS